MKKIATLALSAGLMTIPALSATVANKTFMAARGAVSDNCLLSMGVKPLKSKAADALDGDLSIAAFYRASYNNTKLAQYFGGGTNLIPTGTIEVAPLGASSTTALYGTQIDTISSDSVSAGKAPMYGTVFLDPYRTETGAHLQWVQGLNKLAKGLWYIIALPITVVYTNTQAIYHSTANTTSSAAKGTGKGLADFFNGSDLGKTSPASQVALSRQVLSTSSDSNYAIGIADLKASLGYTLMESNKIHLDCCLHTELPTGNRASGRFLFEPLYGQRNFSMGAGVNSEYVLWQNNAIGASLEVYACAKYTFCFPAAHMRTLGIYSNINGSLPQSQYILVGKSQTNEVLPVANASTVLTRTNPKSRFDAFTGLCCNYKGFTADLAYNFFYSTAENLTLDTAWDEGACGVANTGLADGAISASSPFILTNTALIIGNAILRPGNRSNSNYADFTPASTPAQLIHKFGCGFGYRFGTRIPMRIGAGGEVDVSGDNHSVNSLGAWIKVGLCF
ncbi:MAG: hypothetical protein QG632_75 [Candidatus Dependentiae bacterium]|nr:hypothetical protein [Candidatus Dependentiae bacterium]